MLRSQPERQTQGTDDGGACWDNAPCMDKDRPTDFSARADAGYIAIVFKRAKP